MRITNDDVCGAIVLHETIDILNFLKDQTTKEGFNYVTSLITRGAGIGKLTKGEREAFLQEIGIQTELLYMLLVPMWLAEGRKLPVINDTDILQVFVSGKMRMWREEKTFSTIATSNTTWANVISNIREGCKDSCSATFMAAIAQAFLNKLGPIEAEGTSPVTDNDKVEAPDVDPDISASVNQQLEDLLGEN